MTEMMTSDSVVRIKEGPPYGLELEQPLMNPVQSNVRCTARQRSAGQLGVSNTHNVTYKYTPCPLLRRCDGPQEEAHCGPQARCC
jgi:hypothetical protein